MGVIFLASAPSGEHVVIKTPRPDESTDERVRSRFVQEVKVLEKLQVACPWVTATVLEVHPSADLPYIVMEYLEGQSLHHMSVVQMPLLGGVAVELARALQACHKTGIVHNDLTPANVVVTDDGVRIIDWGLASYPGAQFPPTPQEGTKAYMAPERFAPAPVGSSVDIFSWAGTVAYAGTGRHPFDEQNHIALVAAIHGQEPDLDGIPAEMIPALESAFAKSPEQRPEASELIALLGGSKARGHRESRRRSARRGPPVPADPKPQADDLAAAFSEVKRSLVTLESAGDLVFVTAYREGGGRAGAEARRIEALWKDFWEEYPLAVDVVQRLTGTVTAPSRGDPAPLLASDAVLLPDGTTTSAEALVGQLQCKLDVVAEGTAYLAAEAARVRRAIDSAAPRAHVLVEQAVALGAADDQEVQALGEILAQLTGPLDALDLTSDSIQNVDTAIDAARHHLEEVRRRRAALSAQLSAARLQLKEIEELAVGGAKAFAQAKEKIREPKVLEPLDSSILEHGDEALLPWLARVEQQQSLDDWRLAEEDLHSWQQVADARIADARRIWEVNRAQLRHREELRGKLRAYRAKAAALGRAEDVALAGKHQAARECLYLAPCNLEVAAALVQEYIEGVNRDPKDDDPEDEA